MPIILERHCLRNRLSPTSWHGRNATATDQQYRERATEAREKDAATSDDLSRLVWFEIANGLERLAEQPAKDPVWRVERVERKK
jgi:hypothetical protein